jgi:hypothetical protein
MAPEEVRAYTQELRLLATSPQALGRKLRAESEGRKAASAGPKGVKVGGGKSLEEMMKELEG